MNDQGGFAVEKFIENMGQLDGKIRAARARSVYFSPSPMNNGDTMADLGRNTKIHQYAEALKKFSGETSAPFADQFNAVMHLRRRAQLYRINGILTPHRDATELTQDGRSID